MKVSKMSCHECKGYQLQCPTTQSPTQQHNERQQKNSIAFGKSTSQRIYAKQHTHKIG